MRAYSHMLSYSEDFGAVFWVISPRGDHRPCPPAYGALGALVVPGG